MRKSFDGLWEAMEARRRQVDAGELTAAHRLEQIRQAQGQSEGCPDGEALGGWFEGKLRRMSMRRWFMVWRHVHIRRCRECQAEIAALAVGRSTVRPRMAALTPLWNGGRSPIHRAKTPLVWGSSVLVVMIGLSQWSFNIRHTLPVADDRSEAPLRDDTGPERTSDSEYSGDAQTEPASWDDSPNVPRGHPQPAQSQVDPR